MISPPKTSALLRLLMFWWVLFLIIQQTERFFLLPETASFEPPTAMILVKTLGSGLLGDFTTATSGVVVAALLALLVSPPFALWAWWSETRGGWAYRSVLIVSLGLIAGLLLAVLIADISYYSYNRQHLDFVFFEYVDELLRSTVDGVAHSQAAQQTSAELGDGWKWAVRIGGFLILEGLVIMVWCVGFKRIVGPMLLRWERHGPVTTNVMLAATIVGGAAGLGPVEFSADQAIHLDSEAYHSLAQNPVLFAREPLRDAFFSQWSWAPARLRNAMTLEEAVTVSHEAFGQGGHFPFDRYPFVREGPHPSGIRFDRPVNVVLIFVEGLDRRYLGRTVTVGGAASNPTRISSTVPNVTRSTASPVRSSQLIRVTPFLDRLKDESLYFENFFSNGVQTARGLFSTFCSSYPRQGTAVIKTRSGHDFLCLPSLLRKGGFTTEMLVSLDSDLSGLRSFMERNGLDRFYGERDFPVDAERMGIGLTDAALLDFLRTRIERLHDGKPPFFVAVLTSGMHHPFTVPQRHPDVQALQGEPDQYLAALRYFDVEFERFFTGLQRDGLLKDTIVLVLGDHGRHEPVGQSDEERQGGHFLAPLFIWLDDSLRTTETFRPRTVAKVASQVDLTPTILAINGLVPRVSPLVGRDLSCLFVNDCALNNMTYLTSVYDDLIGLADQDGLWLYSFRRGVLSQIDLKLKGPARHPSLSDPDAALRYRRMLAFYLTSNIFLEENRIWSWQELGEKLWQGS